MAIDQNNVIYISYTDPGDGSVKVAVGEPNAEDVATLSQSVK
jgi:hypothetical protein